MIPVLAKFGFLTIYTFPIIFTIALIGGAFLIWKEAREEDFDIERLFDAIVVSVFFAIIGGRVTTFFLNLDRFDHNWLSLLNIQKYSGIDLEGTVLVGSIAFYLFSRQIKLNVWKGADFLVVGLAFFQFLIMVGHNLVNLQQTGQTNWFALAGSLAVLAVMTKIRGRRHFISYAVLLFLILEAVFLLALALQKVDSVYLNVISKDLIFWLIAAVAGVTLLYMRAKRDVFTDFKAFFSFAKLLKAEFLYVLRSKRARRNMQIKINRFWEKRWFSLTASVFRLRSLVKGVAHVKKAKRH